MRRKKQPFRKEKSRRKLGWMMGITAAVAAVYGLSELLTRTVMSVALERKEPPFMKPLWNIMEGSKKNKGKKTKKAEETPVQSISKLPHQEVEICSFDGLKLVAHWFPHPEAKRVMLACHGWRMTWDKEYSRIFPFWQKNRCSVLLIEQRSHGKSEGDYFGYGMLEQYDCYDWISWLNDHGNRELPIYLTGASLGGTTVLLTSAHALPSNVRGIISDSAFRSAEAVWKHVIQENLHLPYSLWQKKLERICRKKIGYEPDAFSTDRALLKCRVPVLFLHGTGDQFVPVSMTQQNFIACASEKELVLIPDAKHCKGYKTHPQMVEAAVLSFWKKHDR